MNINMYSERNRYFVILFPELPRTVRAKFDNVFDAKITFFFQRLIILSAIIEFSRCEEVDSKSSDATSRIRFVQYQPANAKKDERPHDEKTSATAAVAGEPETKSSQISADASRKINRRQDLLLYNGDKVPSLVRVHIRLYYIERVL